MTEEEYTKNYFNTVETVTAVCKTNSSWFDGEHPELVVGKTYEVSQIGVLRSSTKIRLTGFGDKEYNSACFEIFENGKSIDTVYTKDPRFWAPYRRNEDREDDPCYIAEQIETLAIPAHLRAIEYKHDVKVLLAVESGSRAWGFESHNSDWDVRFIYVHKPEWYFKVEQQRDVIEHFYEDDVDLAGWELRKALTLFQKSNPSLLEWFNSPKVYYADEEFVRRMHEVEKDYFNPIKTMYHYNHMYIKQNERYLQKRGYLMKRFLYYLRGILACKWIEKNKSMPPVLFRELLDATIEDEAIRAKVDKLIRLKKSGKEHDMLTFDDSLVAYAQQLANYYNEVIGSFRPELHKANANALDAILYDMVITNA